MGYHKKRSGPTDTPLETLRNLRDDDIVRRAQLWATGATIHDVNGLIGSYRSAADALDGWLSKPDADPVLVRFGLEFMNYARCALEDFMRHGDYRKAVEDNPLPWHPDDERLDREREERRQRRERREQCG